MFPLSCSCEGFCWDSVLGWDLEQPPRDGFPACLMCLSRASQTSMGTWGVWASYWKREVMSASSVGLRFCISNKPPGMVCVNHSPYAWVRDSVILLQHLRGLPPALPFPQQSPCSIWDVIVPSLLLRLPFMSHFCASHTQIYLFPWTSVPLAVLCPLNKSLYLDCQIPNLANIMIWPLSFWVGLLLPLAGRLLQARPWPLTNFVQFSGLLHTLPLYQPLSPFLPLSGNRPVPLLLGSTPGFS